MPSHVTLQDKFYTLQDLLIKNPESIATHTGIPFVLLIYNPQDEYICQQLKNDTFQKLKDRAIKYVDIHLNKKIFEWLEEEGVLEQSFQIEASARTASNKEDLTNQLASIIKEKLIAHIIEISNQDSNQIIFLSRAGSLYPFVRVSNILSELENKIKNILVVFYPGSQEGKNLRFLNTTEGYYYRAMKI